MKKILLISLLFVISCGAFTSSTYEVYQTGKLIDIACKRGYSKHSFDIDGIYYKYLNDGCEKND